MAEKTRENCINAMEASLNGEVCHVLRCTECHPRKCSFHETESQYVASILRAAKKHYEGPVAYWFDQPLSVREKMEKYGITELTIARMCRKYA